MKKVIRIVGVCIAFMTGYFSQAQQGAIAGAGNYLSLSWKQVATRMPDDWYGSDEAKVVAENVLFCQHTIGGWSKNKPYHHALSDSEKTQVEEERSQVGATFDNGATITEMLFLARVYRKNDDARYRDAFLKAFDYILKAQYKNGGWPQFYPFRVGKSIAYNTHITFNDDAMVNVMKLLRDIADEYPLFASLQLDAEARNKARAAFDKGIDCILKTQIRVNGQLTVWCAQHDENTLAPANARSYELASYSGSESVGITLLLMDIKDPSKAIIEAVQGSYKWFKEHGIKGIKLQRITNSEGNKDLQVVADKDAPVLWARFYDLETEQPFFCDRDGIKRKTFGELGYNRRNGYSWYTNAPERIFKEYESWARQWVH